MATLIKNKRIAPDNWQLLKRAADGAQLGKSPELPVTGDWIVPLAIWTEQRAQLSQRSGRNGVLLENTEDPSVLANDFDQLALIAVRFPKFTDGRGYSIARLLRRLGWKGELRAVGDVLRDQLFYLQRVGFNAFANREAKRRRRKNAALILAGLVFAGSCLAWWDFTRTKVEYYAHLSEKFGVPTGLVRLSKEFVRHRESSYKIESSRGNVRRVVHVNGAGFPSNDKTENFCTAIQEVHYREDGALQFIDLKSPTDALVARLYYSFSSSTDGNREAVLEFKDNIGRPLSMDALSGSISEQKALPINSMGSRRSEITAHRFFYSKDGKAVKISYLNDYRFPRSNKAGVFGRQLKYDNKGFIFEIVFCWSLLDNCGLDSKFSNNCFSICCRA